MDVAVSAEGAIGSVLASWRDRLADRALVLRADVDPALRLEDRPALRSALDALIGLAAETAPDDCELYLAVSRPAAVLSAVGAARLVLRWQVVDPVDESGDPDLVPIRPGAGGAASVARSEAAGRVRSAFEGAGWSFDLEPTVDGAELVGRAGVG